MNKVLGYILVCMLIVETIMLMVWFFAIIGVSPVPANILPMQAIALVASITATGTIYVFHKRKHKH